MTAVVATRLHGNIVLIGDIVVTDPEKRVHYAQKVYRFGHNLALGWSGNYVQAKQLVAYLTDRLRDDEITYKRLRSVLASTDARFTEVDLVGWLVDRGKESYIRWSGAMPSVLDTSSEGGVGDGAPTLFEHLRSEGEGNVSGIYLTIAAAIQKAGDARAQEILAEPGSWPMSWGLGYDVVFFTEGRFMWVPSITCVCWRIDMTADGSIVSIEQNGLSRQHRWRGPSYSQDRTIVQEKERDGSWRTTVCEHLGDPELLAVKPPAFHKSFAVVVELRIFINGAYLNRISTAYVKPRRGGLLRIEGEFDKVTFSLDEDMLRREVLTAFPDAFSSAILPTPRTESGGDRSQGEPPEDAPPGPFNTRLHRDTVVQQVREQAPAVLQALQVDFPELTFMVVAGDASDPNAGELLAIFQAGPLSEPAAEGQRTEIRDRIRAQVWERELETGNMGFQVVLTTESVAALLQRLPIRPECVADSVNVIATITTPLPPGWAHVIIITHAGMALGTIPYT